MRHRLEIHDDVTADQLAVRVGDRVIYTRDDGTEFATTVRFDPGRLGDGTRVVWVAGVAGCVALCRVRPMEDRS